MDTKKVTLVSEELGKREFVPAHAKKLLALQKHLKVDHWKEVTEAKPKSKIKTDDTNGAAGTNNSQSSE